MKINEKHLCAFAVGSAPIDKQGFLMKRGEGNRAFQRRWFVLKGNLLFYFEKPADREPLGVIIIQDCTIEIAENEDAYAFELDFEGVGSRTYVLAADNQEEMEDWIRALTSASYDFMKVRLKEWQQRLDDLNSELSVAKQKKTASSSVDSDGSLTTVNDLMQLDLLCAGSKETDVQEKKSSVVNPTHVRNFEEMHIDFGDYIREKVFGQLFSINPLEI